MPKTFNRDIELGGTSRIMKNGSEIVGSTGTVTIANSSITRAKMSSAAGSKSTGGISGTISTTGNTDLTFIVPETGTVSAVYFNGADALSANDTNYITFSLTNMGQAGAGTTNILAAGDPNTTKATGGSAIAANTLRTLSLSATGGDLVVNAGDLLRFRAAATGTLANQVTVPRILITYAGTT